MPRTLPFTQVSTIFPNPPWTLRRIFEERGLFSVDRGVRRVDMEKLKAAYPDHPRMHELEQQEEGNRFCGIQELARLLPLSGLETRAQLRAALTYGEWPFRQVTATSRLYELRHFQDITTWQAPGEREFYIRSLVFPRFKTDLGKSIGELCKAWSEILEEKRLGVRRARGEWTQAHFTEEYARLKKLVEDAPWDAPQVKKMLEACHV